MSKTIVSITIFLLVCAIVVVAPPRWGQDSGLASLIDKHDRLHNISSPKIVLIGGSNVSTGVDSHAIQNALGYRVVNMGLGASLGLRYMLEEVKPDVARGDVLVILPEYDYFCVTSRNESNARLDGSSDLIHLWQCFPGSWKWITAAYCNSPEHLLGLVGDVQRFITLKTSFVQRVLGEMVKERSFKVLQQLERPKHTIYTHRNNYNDCGDFIGHLNLKAPGIDGQEMVCYGKYEFNDQAARALADFGVWCKSRSASVYIVPPPLPCSNYEKYKSRIDDICNHWRAVPNVAVLASASRYTFAKEQFFDTPYHLNAGGRGDRTSRIIEDLKFLCVEDRSTRRACLRSP